MSKFSSTGIAAVWVLKQFASGAQSKKHGTPQSCARFFQRWRGLGWTWQICGRKHWRHLPGKINSNCLHVCSVNSCFQYLLFKGFLCARSYGKHFMYYLIPNQALKDWYNDPHLSDEETGFQRVKVCGPRHTAKVQVQSVMSDSQTSVLTLCKVWRGDRWCQSQTLHPGNPLSLQLPRQRCGVSWSNLAHWLINLTGVHSRKGKVKKEGKVARSFFKEKKAGPPPPPAWRCAQWWSAVFGCLAAAVLPAKVAVRGSVHLTLLKSRASETVAYHKAPEVSVSGWVLPCTWHSESTCRWTAKMPVFFFFPNPR